jgi:adenylylsulfate kinase
MTGAIVWITGLPASGKSTFAARLRAVLVEARVPCAVLDGDEVREALDHRDHTLAGRGRFYRALAALAANLARQGLTVLVPATAPLRSHRDEARARFARVLEIHVQTSLAECERRDPKGLYALARAGQAPDLPGAGTPYEPPDHPDVVAAGGEDGAAIAAAARLISRTA